jgi:hypothetical protein
MTHTNTKRIILAVLCYPLFCVGQASAQDDRDASPGPDYVRAPAGWFHKDCTLAVPDGAVIVERNGAIAAELDGVEIKGVAKCEHPAKLISPRAPAIATNGRAAPPPPPSINGWLEYAYLWAPNNAWNMPWYNGVINSWTVPNNPAVNGGLLYFFNGLEPSDGSAIIQPVLQYGTSPAGGGNFWGIATWYVAGSTVVFTSVGQVSPGDVVTGRMTGNSCTTAGACSWFIKIGNNGNVVTRSMTTAGGGKTYTWASPAVAEFYSVSTCSRMPSPGQATFTNTYLFTPGPATSDQNDVTLSSAWSTVVDGPAVPSCGYSESLFTRGATLNF